MFENEECHPENGVTLFTLEFFMQTQLYITEISGSGDF